MKVAFFSTKAFDRKFFQAANEHHGFEFSFFEPRLDQVTAKLAARHDAVCAFVNDILDQPCLEQLAEQGIKFVALRCAGFNNVDLRVANELNISIARVPAYSPHSVAEHTLALILALNRKVHRAYNRVRESNFALDGLLGFDIHGLTAGVVGTGKIGANVMRILSGFGCRVLAYDPYPNEELTGPNTEYTDLDTLLNQADIVTLHCPLTPESHHLIDESAISKMKHGVMLINTSRGGLVDTKAVIYGLKSGQIGYLGLDVYEEEGDLFFEDLSDKVLQDDTFARLTTFPNVIITGHQAFFTEDALTNIAQTSLQNIAQFLATGQCDNSVSTEKISS